MSTTNQVISFGSNNAGVALAKGAVVRSAGNPRQTALAQADTLANLLGVYGLANNATGVAGSFNVVVAGEAPCLLETGLSPVVGQTVYVSATVAGRGTNVVPALAFPLGSIIDASKYATTRVVTIAYEPSIGVQTSGIADWVSTMTRYFIVDNDLGLDTNVGYIDAVEGTNLSATAPGVAVKTLERLLTIIPTIGNNRRAQIIGKARSDGGRYLAADGVTESSLNLNIVGYQRFILRGTGTVTSAGATAWANDAADLVCQGGRIATGTDAAGYKLSYNLIGTVTGALPGPPVSLTVTAHGLVTGDYVFVESVFGTTGANGCYPITVIDANNFSLDGAIDTEAWLAGGTQRVYAARITKADGTAAGFTADSADTTITGLRVRYDSGSSAGVANVINSVWANSAASILFASPWATVPLTSDVFYLEEPGLNIRRVAMSAVMGYVETAATGGTHLAATATLSGFKTATLNLGRPSYANLVFAHPLSFGAADMLELTMGITGVFAGTSSTTVGCNRVGDSTGVSTSSLSITKCQSVAIDHTYHVRRTGTVVALLANLGRLRVGQAFGCARGMIIRNVGASPGSTSGQAVTAQMSCFGRIGTGGSMPVRVFGPESASAATTPTGLVIDQSAITCQSLVAQITAAGGIGISVAGNGCRVTLSNVNGSNNAAYGLSTNANINAVTEGGSRDNTVLISHLQVLPNGIAGVLGAYQVAARENNTAVVSKVDLTSNLAYSDLVDSNGCRLSVVRTSPGELSTQVKLQLQRTAGYVNGTGGTLARYRVVRATTVRQEIALAQANTEANATGVLGALFNAPLTTAYGLVAQVGEENFIEFDRSGAHPAPTIGQLAYLSVDTAGLAQADVPATAATNQLFVLGVITAIHPTNINIAAIQLQFSPRPQLA